MSSPALPSTSVQVPALPGRSAPVAPIDLAASTDLGPSTDLGTHPDAAPSPDVTARHRRRRLPSLADSERGMTTAEYAVGTVAACGFGGVLYKTVTSDVVAQLVTDIIRRALTLSF